MKKVLLIALVGILVAGVSNADAQVTKQQIVGTWSVLSVVANKADGDQFEVFGPHPQGQFTFTAGGNFSIHISRSGHLDADSHGRSSGAPPEENKDATVRYFSEYGTYTFSSDGSLLLHIIGSSVRNLDGTEQKRSVQITNDEMKWATPNLPIGNGNIVIRLKRAKKE
jgi:hypothetical protein